MLITDAGPSPLAQDNYNLWTATIAHRKGVTGSPPCHYTLAVIGYPLCQNYELRWETPYPTLLEAAVYIESFLVEITTSLLEHVGHALRGDNNTVVFFYVFDERRHLYIEALRIEEGLARRY